MSEIPDDQIGELAIRLPAFFARRVDTLSVDDLVNETLVRVLDPESSWDPARGTLVQFAFGVVVRDVLRDHFREKERFLPFAPDDAPGSEPTCESDVASQLEARRLRELARGDPIVALMVERELGAEDSSGELWRVLDFSPSEIRNARRRFARLLDRFDEAS